MTATSDSAARSWRPLLRSIAATLAADDAGQARWLDGAPSDDDAVVPQAPSHATTLADIVYARFYAGFRLADDIGTAPAPADAAGPVGGWSDGWQVESVRPGGALALRQAGFAVHCPAGQYHLASAPRPVRPGDTVARWIAGASDAVQPGFRYFWGEESRPEDAEFHTHRWYLNGGADRGALARAVAEALRERRIGFTLKVWTDARLRRRDNIVLYVSSRLGRPVARCLAGLLPAARLEADVPAFTRRLADGIAIADAPAGGASFGMAVATAIADGIRSVPRTAAPAQRFAAIVAALRAAGVDPARPWRLYPKAAFPAAAIALGHSDG